MSNSTPSNAGASTTASAAVVVDKGLHCLILGCGGIAMGIALQLLISREDVIEKLVFVVRDDAKGQEAVSDMISLLKKQSSKATAGNGNSNGQASNSNTPTITSKKSEIKSDKENNLKQRIEYIVADLSLMKSSLEGVKKYMSKYSACDIIISAAGEGIQTGITSTTIEKENRIFASNLLGHVIFTSYLLPLLRKSSSSLSSSSSINRGTILFTVGEQKNYKDLPDVKNLRFESIQRMQSSAAGSVTSNQDGSSVEDLQRTPSKTNSINASSSKSDKNKRKSQGKQQSENKQLQQQIPSPYSAAKVGMFCMAMEIARKNPELHIGLINPGIVRTNFHKDCGENIPDEFFTSTPEDVGELVDWILSSPELFTKQSNDALKTNVAKMFKVKTKLEIPILDAPSNMRFGENVLDEKAQADIYEAILQHLGINEKDALLNEKSNTLSSPSSRSVKSGSSGSSSRGKSLVASKCNIM